MGENVLRVRMLGGFELNYGGKSFSIERNNATKVNQLLQLLLFHEDGIERTKLQEYLFEGEDITNPSNSLRALVFRLRKILPEHNFPNDEFVNISKGIYSWTKAIPVESDVKCFQNIISKAAEIENETEKMMFYREAFNIYEGAFLPMISEARWVSQIDLQLKDLFFECTKKLCDYYIETESYEDLLHVAEKAAKFYPYNEWQFYQMRALIELKRDKEAIRLYEATENMMFDELGVSVSKEMTAMLDRLGSQVKNRTDLISTVKANLDTTKKDEEGTFCCSYPSFLENYRYIKRVIKRSGQNAWLMLVTITDGKGYALEEGERLEKLSRELSESISSSCRGGDMYTRYSDNQFLILLIGINKEDCTIVENRINSNMDKDSRKRYLQYHLAPVGASGATNDIENILKDMN